MPRRGLGSRYLGPVHRHLVLERDRAPVKRLVEYAEPRGLHRALERVPPRTASCRFRPPEARRTVGWGRGVSDGLYRGGGGKRKKKNRIEIKKKWHKKKK